MRYLKINPLLYILSAPVHSGKSSWLRRWMQNKDVGGFLSPDLHDIRFLQIIPTGELIPFQVKDPTIRQGYTSIGKYNFYNEGFETGMRLIDESLEKNFTYFIIDEYGKLELEGQGFGPACDRIIKRIGENKSGNTIYLWVVRDYLLESFLIKYNLDIQEEGSWPELASIPPEIIL